MDFIHKKKYGQNFLSDTNLLRAIVADADIDKTSDVLEIGPGLGSLTYELSRVANKVISYEIDKELIPILNDKFENSNVTIINQDILKANIIDIENMFVNNYILVANLPYYITTPIIFKFIENAKKLSKMIIMVQQEVAERICAKTTDKEYGITSVLIDAVGDCKITRKVNRKMFIPIPNVDSAILRIDLRHKYDIDFKKFSILVNKAFAMRRKTLINNLMSYYKIERKVLEQYLQSLNLKTDVRAENLTTEQFVMLYKYIYNK